MRVAIEGEMRLTTREGVRIVGHVEETRPDGSWVARDVVLGFPLGGEEGKTVDVTARRARGRFRSDAQGRIGAEGSPIFLEGVSGAWIDPERSEDPVRFETPEAEVDLERRWLRAPRRAAVATGGLSLEGAGLDADLASGRYQFARDVRFVKRDAGEETTASCGGPAFLRLDPEGTDAGRAADLELVGDVRIERRLGEETWSGRAQRFTAHALLPARETAEPADASTPFRLRRVRLEEGVEIAGFFGTLLASSFEATFDGEGRLEALDVAPRAFLVLEGSSPFASNDGSEGRTFVECRGGIEAWRAPTEGYEALLPGPTKVHSPGVLLPSILRGPVVLRSGPTVGQGAPVESLVAMGGAWIRVAGAFALAPVAEIRPGEAETRLRIGPSPRLEASLAPAGGTARLSGAGWGEIVSGGGEALTLSFEREVLAVLAEDRWLRGDRIRIARGGEGFDVEADGSVRLRDAARGVEASGESLRMSEAEGLDLEGAPARLSADLDRGRVAVSAPRVRAAEDRIGAEGGVVLELPAALSSPAAEGAPGGTTTVSGERFAAALDPQTQSLRDAWVEGSVVLDGDEFEAKGDRLDLDRATGELRLTSRDLVSVSGSSQGYVFETRAPLARMVEAESALVLEPRGELTITPLPTEGKPEGPSLASDPIHATFEGTARLEETSLRIEGRVAAEGRRGPDEAWTLDADRFDARFGPARRAEEVRAGGDVAFRFGEAFRAWGDEVVYLPGTEVVRVRGAPARCDSGSGELWAERVEYDLRRRLVLRVERGSIALSR